MHALYGTCALSLRLRDHLGFWLENGVLGYKHGDHLGPIKASYCDADLVEYPKTHRNLSSLATHTARELDECLCLRCAELWKAPSSARRRHRYAARHAGTSTLRSTMVQSKPTKLTSFFVIDLKAIPTEMLAVLFTEKAQ